MATTSYVIHCKECKRLIKKEDRHNACPPEPEVRPIKWNPTTDPRAYERKRYPYFDNGLGEVVTSNQHKRQILKDNGLVQVDGKNKPRPKSGVIYSFPK